VNAVSKMNSENEPNPPTVEQSWIVLDDHGWPSSRPPTASPTRPVPHLSPFHEDDDVDDEGDQHNLRRIGMDENVREALELAERSLELAGRADEFSNHHFKAVSDEEANYRSSPLNNYVTKQGQNRTEDQIEDPYNGRGPPTVKRTYGISSDIESTSFRNIKVVNSMTEVQPPRVSTPMSDHDKALKRTIIPPEIDAEDSEEGFLQWMFGLQGNASLFPLVLTHGLTLIAGFYLGVRRASAVSGTNASSSSNVSAVGHQ
jgi:hypothetical protein